MSTPTIATPAVDVRVGHDEEVDRYHLHEPWVMPATFLDAVFTQAYPTKRFPSIWIGLVGHVLPSFLMLGVFLPLVLK